MVAQFIQAQILQKSKEYIQPIEGCHVKKIKAYYYLIKTTQHEFRIITKSGTKFDRAEQV